MSVLHDKELAQYRDLVQAPSTFEDGFGWRTVLGAVFVGLVMLPASMYMSLMVGESIGPAAKWVTVILFLEMAKRARSGLRPAEIFIMFAMVGTLVSSPMQNFFWRQFLVQSEAARSYGLTEMFPDWYAPTDMAVLDQQNFFMWEWFVPLILVFVGMIIGRIDQLILGYGLFRVASDVEKLPFPMAPLGVAGVTALAENQSGKEGWRWRCFSVGTVLGLGLGFLYMGVPILSNALGLQEPVRIVPIPWLDTSVNTEGLLPATPTGISFDPSNFFLGMALPFFGVLGAFIAVLITLALNPALHHFGWLTTWRPGQRTPEILFSNNLDFYMSFGIGLAAAVALIGLWQCISGLRQARSGLDAGVDARAVQVDRKGRGDIANWLVVFTYIISSILYIVICGWLVDWKFDGNYLLWVLLFFAFVYTPLVSYVTARLEGLVGQALHIPYVKELAFIFSGYKGIDVWLLPVPMHDYGQDTVNYRSAELVGCSFRSIWKLSALTVPLVFLLSLVYGQFIWSLGPIPSPVYPYAQEIWELNARNQCVVFSSTAGGYSPFLDAIHPELIGAGAAVGLGVYAVLAAFGLPVLLLYGVIKGLGGSIPQMLVIEMLGALFGRYVMAPRFGADNWRQYAPVVFAGYACGAGLIAMFAVGARFLSASVYQLTY